MIPSQREYEIFGKGQTRIYVCCYVTIVSSIQLLLSSLNANWTQQKHPMKCYHVGLPRLQGGFNGLRCLSDSEIIPLQIPMALYQRRTNGVIGEEQYPTIQQNPASFLYKY